MQKELRIIDEQQIKEISANISHLKQDLVYCESKLRVQQSAIKKTYMALKRVKYKLSVWNDRFDKLDGGFK